MLPKGTLKRRLLPTVAAAITSPKTRDLRRRANELRRRATGAKHEVHYFHQADDPYGYLVAQCLDRVVTRFDVTFVWWLVGPPSDAMAPERERLDRYALDDAAAIAPHFDLDPPKRRPDADATRRANRILASAMRADRFAEAAPIVGRACFSDGDLDVAAETFGEAEPDLAAGDKKREGLGHYNGATFSYGGEWYWGIDRLHYLERRLVELGLGNGAPTLSAPRVSTSRSTIPQTVEAFVSMRSPYSYLALDRTFSLPERYGVELVLRPVLPMVMRGLPVPTTKRFYILLDAAREAHRLGIPFGRVADPVGVPIERVYSLFPWARDHGCAEALFSNFARAAWAEGIDTGSDSGLAKVVERAGLSWSEAKQHVDTEDWRAEIETNQAAMLDAGLWGVPSYRLRSEGHDDFLTWGRDRLWLLETEIAQRGTATGGGGAGAGSSSSVGTT